MRYLWATAGLVCMGLAFVGVFLPLLPTVPFLLLAAFCFARSSERLHNWLLTHPTFGPSVVDWQERRAISMRSKRAATLSIAVVFGVSVAVGFSALILGIQAIVLSAVLLFLWTRPNA